MTNTSQKMKSKGVAIIGCGASALICAIFCAKNSSKVTIFEQNEKCGKKILVSGNGRCNISNRYLGYENYFGQNPSFVIESLKKFGFKDFEKFCNSIGLLLDIKDDGRAYPLSNESKSVTSLLVNYAKELGVEIKTQTKISSAKELFCHFETVVIATGLKAAQHLGGCDDGCRFAKEFKHNILPPYPSLVQLHLNSKIAHKMSGSKTDAKVTLLINNKKEITTQGDILFTNYGISGFAILDISQNASLALQEYAKVDISINLLPTFDNQKLSSHILKVAKNMQNLLILDMLNTLIPLKIAQGILKTLQLDEKSTLKTIDTKLSKKIANQILNWNFEVIDTHGFRHAEVCGGGIDTDEINPATMESLKQKGLYFCGEVIDIVGKRGGYNFAWAWASGYSAAQDIIKKKPKKD